MLSITADFNYRTSNYKISIITPAYNAEKYILKNLECISCQTYQNIEHIIVNDGSTDDTKIIVEKYISDHPGKTIKLVNIPNGGLANARNVGIQAAEGEYICNLDADDFLDFDILEKVANFDTDFDICFWGYKEIDEDTGKIITEYHTRFAFFNGIKPGYEAALLKMKRTIWICQGVAVYKLKMIKDNNIWNKPGINQGEDFYFIIRSLICAQSVCCIPVNAFNCLIRNDSMMHSPFNESYLQTLEMFKLLTTDVSHYDFINDDVRSELILYIQRYYFYERINIAKNICNFFNYSKFNEAVKKIKYFDKDTEIRYKDIRAISPFLRKIEYSVFNTSKYLFFFFCKLYIFIFKRKKTLNV